MALFCGPRPLRFPRAARRIGRSTIARDSEGIRALSSEIVRPALYGAALLGSRVHLVDSSARRDADGQRSPVDAESEVWQNYVTYLVAGSVLRPSDPGRVATVPGNPGAQ